jgi:hypothetical protein
MSNAVNESIELPIPEEEETAKHGDTFPLAIRELGESLFLNYPNKTSNLSDENILGMIRIEALNDFMQSKYGFRYSVLDIVVQYKKELVISKNGFGISAFNDLVKSIQASFQQTEIPQTIGQRLMRR